MVKCQKCKIEKEESDFAKSTKRKNGLQERCRSCCKKYRKDNALIISDRKRKAYLQNRDAILRQKKEYHQRTRDKQLKKSAKYYRENKVRILKQMRDQYDPAVAKAANDTDEARHKVKMYVRKRKAIDPLYRLIVLIRRSIRHSFDHKKYTKHVTTLQLIGVSFEEFSAYLGPKPPGKYHLDHICPCAQAQDVCEFIKLQHYTNFRWLPASENLAKSDNRTPEGEVKCLELLGRAWIDK